MSAIHAPMFSGELPLCSASGTLPKNFPYDADYSPSATAFTIEGFAKPTVDDVLMGIVSLRPAGSSLGYVLYRNTSEQIELIGWGPVIQVLNIAVTSALVHFYKDQYSHFSMCKSSDNWYVSINGTVVSGTASTVTLSGTTPDLRLGADSSTYPTRDWQGCIGGVIKTPGVAKYTANFTPPTAPFPNS